jgi:hypothetical protein
VAEEKVLSAFQEAHKRAADELEVLNRVVARHCREQEQTSERKAAKNKKK